MLSSSSRACSPVSTGVLPRLTSASGRAPRARDWSRDLAGDEPVEQHADRGEVLLDGRLLEFAEPADIGRDVDRLDIDQLVDIVAPSHQAKKLWHACR